MDMRRLDIFEFEVLAVVFERGMRDVLSSRSERPSLWAFESSKKVVLIRVAVQARK